MLHSSPQMGPEWNLCNLMANQKFYVTKNEACHEIWYGYDNIYWIELAQNRVHWWASLLAVLSFKIYVSKDFMSNFIPVPIILPASCTGQPRFESRHGIAVSSRLHSACHPVYTEGFSVGVSLLQCEADHARSSAVKVKTVCIFSPVCHHVVRLNKVTPLRGPPLLLPLYHHLHHDLLSFSAHVYLSHLYGMLLRPSVRTFRLKKRQTDQDHVWNSYSTLTCVGPF